MAASGLRDAVKSDVLKKIDEDFADAEPPPQSFQDSAQVTPDRVWGGWMPSPTPNSSTEPFNAPNERDGKDRLMSRLLEDARNGRRAWPSSA